MLEKGVENELVTARCIYCGKTMKFIKVEEPEEELHYPPKAMRKNIHKEKRKLSSNQSHLAEEVPKTNQ